MTEESCLLLLLLLGFWKGKGFLVLSERRKLFRFLSLSFSLSKLLISHLEVADGRGVDDVADDKALDGLVLGDEDARRLAADALDLLVERRRGGRGKEGVRKGGRRRGWPIDDCDPPRAKEEKELIGDGPRGRERQPSFPKKRRHRIQDILMSASEGSSHLKRGSAVGECGSD